MRLMATRTPPPHEIPRRPQVETEQVRSRPEAVALLERLLQGLFPEPNSLDLITVDDIVRRYPLTGLGAPALAAIEQSQRIVRSRGDYVQSGLGEFHIGLIYLNWEDGRAAANQFAMARQPWSLAGDYAAMCLAHFAQGLALYHAFHNEAAMMQFGRAERLMTRATVGSQGERLAGLAAEMRPLLTIAQDTLRVALWPEEEANGVMRSQYLTVPPAAENVIYGQPPQPAPADVRRAFVRAPRLPDAADGVPLPISNLPGGLGDMERGPVPGHIAADDRFGWYIVAGKRGNFLPDVGQGAWLLGNIEAGERVSSGREYVVVGSARPDLGNISVRPISRSSALPFCYLGYRQADDTGQAGVFLDDSAHPAAEDVVVLAVVEGFWLGLNGQN